MDETRVDTDTKLTSQQLGKIKAELLLGDLEEAVAKTKSYMDQYNGATEGDDMDRVRLLYTHLQISLDHRLRQEDKTRLDTNSDKAIPQVIAFMNALRTKYGYSPDNVRVMTI
jgi:hypothetical protein